MLSHWQQADFDMLVLPIPSHMVFSSGEMLKFIIQILINDISLATTGF